jgi:hypothetical protein
VTTKYSERPAVRIAMGWRTFYVYNAAGELLGKAGGFHEEGARREVAMIYGVDHEDLKAEVREREAA